MQSLQGSLLRVAGVCMRPYQYKTMLSADDQYWDARGYTVGFCSS